MNSSNLANQEIDFPSIIHLIFKQDFLEVHLSDGRILSVPVAWYPKLMNATSSQRDHWEISPGGYGVHWPDLDEDLSVQGFLFP